jgi:two-component system, NarL family, nitrate/nitrite response regulator NarL
VLGPRIGPSLLESLHSAGAALPAPLAELTPRERELLEHLVAGRSNGQIARALGLSEKTIRNGFSSVFAKLQVSDRVQAALLAKELGVSA